VNARDFGEAFLAHARLKALVADFVTYHEREVTRNGRLVYRL